MFDEDLSAFFDPSDFALAAIFNGSIAVNVLLERNYFDQFGAVAGSKTVAYGRAVDFDESSALGKTLLVSAVTYTIRRVERVQDGNVVRLHLEF